MVGVISSHLSAPTTKARPDDALPQILRAHTIEAAVDHLRPSSDVLETRQTYGAHLLRELAQKGMSLLGLILSLDVLLTSLQMKLELRSCLWTQFGPSLECATEMVVVLQRGSLLQLLLLN
jgi:hypothetical protein